MSQVLIEGMREVKDFAKANGGQLSLPKQFDRTKFAAKWAKEGLEAESQQQEQPVGNKIMVSGWAVWKHAGKLCRRILGSGRYILMCRPRLLQNAVNAVCGNLSRERIIGEHKGTQRDGENESLPANGMLTLEQLNRLEPNPAEAQELKLPFNLIPAAPSARNKNKK